jgi:hypothetical protein
VRLYSKAKMFHRRAARVDGGRTQKSHPQSPADGSVSTS